MACGILLATLFVGCDSDESVMAPDMAGDMFVCHPVTAPTTSTACQGTAACPPGQICLLAGGMLLDGGFTQGQCMTLPPECQTCGGCISNGGTQVAIPVGCFATICHSFACSFGAGILVCE